MGALTSKIARDGLVLFCMIAQLDYCGKHIELDLVCNGKSGLLELGRHGGVRGERGRWDPGSRYKAHIRFPMTDGVGNPANCRTPGLDVTIGFSWEQKWIEPVTDCQITYPSHLDPFSNKTTGR